MKVGFWEGPEWEGGGEGGGRWRGCLGGEGFEWAEMFFFLF